MRHLLPLALCVVGFAHAAPSKADARAEYIRTHYTKYELRIPMRDGVRLHTAVFIPRARGQAYPILMRRTPYGVDPYGPDRYPRYLGANRAFEEEGFIFVAQDVRGRMMSEGEFIQMRPLQAQRAGAVDESTDTYDTIEWLLTHLEGHNGKVGIHGISYAGFYASSALVDPHPALAAASPQGPIADWFFDDVHRNGAFSPMVATFFYSMEAERDGPSASRPEPLDLGTMDGHRFFMELGPMSTFDERYFKGKIGFWNDIVAHPNYDAFWQARGILPHLKANDVAVLVVGGWYDNEDPYGTIHTYRALDAADAAGRVRIAMGPWRHGGWRRGPGDTLGDLSFGFPNVQDFIDRVELPFFKHHLKGGPDPDLPEAMMFETGANRWRRFARWPPQETQARALHLQAKGALTWAPPTTAGEVSFISDPAKPVPYAAKMTPYWSKTFMAEDQRFSGWRPDVLVFETPPLEAPLTIAGPMTARLFVSTDQQDADWVVKVIDVWPGEAPGARKSAAPWRQAPGKEGQQALVQAGVIRGRFRESFSEPKPFVPGEVTPVAFELYDVMHTFKRGHRVQVQVQSTWFPYVDRNPQKWVDNIFEAKAEDFVKATHTVFASPEHPSRVELRVLPALDARLP